MADGGTDCCHAEQRIRENEEKLRALFDAATESILLVDREARILTLNRTAAQDLGGSIEELVGRTLLDVSPRRLSPAQAQRRVAMIREVFDSGQANRLEDVRADACLDSTLYPVFGAGGGVVSVAVFSWDVTERKRLERKLQESEERYRTVVDSVGETIAIVDARGVFQFMNTTAGRRLGGRPADFVGKTMWDLFPAEVADAQAAHIRAVVESGQGRTTVSLTNVCGQARWYCTTIEPLRDGGGSIMAGLVVARDIHDLQTARQELDTHREKMIRAEHLASLGTLSAMLSHEMTQPLMVIRLAIQNAMTLLDGASCEPAALEDLRDGLAGVANATALVERFRDFAGRMSAETTGEVSLAAAARRVVRLLEEDARQARIVLSVDLPDDLARIRSHGNQIEQVFFLLAQNAVQAADGLRDRCFRICGAGRAGAVELQFADDCGGIAPQILDRLFEPFVTTKPPGEGTGLGLCVVQRLVSQMSGSLKVDSRWGEGTTFFLTLPMERK